MGLSGISDGIATAGEHATRVAGSSQRYLVTWGGLPGCKVPAPAARERARQLAHDLEKAARITERLHIHLVADADPCAAWHTGDIGLQDRSSGVDGPEEATVDVLLAQGGALTRRVATAVAWSELPTRLSRLIRTYQVEGCGKDTFSTWAANLSDAELRERLGLPKLESDRGILVTQ